MKTHLSKIIRLITNKAFILSLISISLFLIPVLLWFNGKYYIGGDDSMIYYLYPKEMAVNAVRLESVNPFGDLGVYIVPFFELIYISKQLVTFINTQTLFYGLNLSMGFLFFYLFLKQLILDKSPRSFYIRIFSSLFYIFSIFSFTTLWSGTYVVYLVSIFPLALFLFFKSVEKHNVILIILLSLILSIFSILVFATPWLVLAIISIIPLLFNLFKRHKKQFIINSSVLLILFIVINIYWIYPILNQKNTQALINNMSAKEEINGAKILIKEVSSQNTFVYPFLNLFYPNLATEGYKKFESYHELFSVYNLLLVIVVVLPLVLEENIEKNQKPIYFCLFFSWLMLIYFFTVNIFGKLGLTFFQFLLENVPGFIMFRNNYGKIAPSYPFIFACLLGVSLNIIFIKYKSKKIKILLLTSMIFITILNALPIIRGDYFNSPIWSTKATFPLLSQFNPDYIKLSSYIVKNLQGKKILWFPATTINYVLIKDVNSNNYYSGVSPLRLMFGVLDVPGLLSMPNYSEKYASVIKNGDLQGLKSVLKDLRINYIIINNDISRDLQSSYLFSLYSKGDFYRDQKKINILSISSKIVSFGKKYDLYQLN